MKNTAYRLVLNWTVPALVALGALNALNEVEIAPLDIEVS
jgi:hypothetical protein